MEENRIETMEMDNTEIQELGYADYDESGSAEGNGGKALLIAAGIVVAGTGLVIANWKKIKKLREDRILAKAEKIITKREAAEEIVIEPDDFDEEVVDNVETEE